MSPSLDPDALIPGTLMARLGITWGTVAADRVEATMPVEGNTQPFGLLHGGATAALIESAASIGATLATEDGARVALCIDITVHHLGSVRDGMVTAVATPLRAGKNVQVWNVAVHDDGARDVAVGRCSFVLREPASHDDAG